MRGKRTYGGRPGQRVEEQGTWAAQKHSEAGYGRPVDRGVWTAKTVKRPRQQPAHPQYANYWAPLTRKRHTMPHSAQPQHANYWAPRTRKRHQQEHRPQRPTESSDPTQHAEGRTGDCPGPRKGATTRRNVTQGGRGVRPTLERRTPSGGAPPPLPQTKVTIAGNSEIYIRENLIGPFWVHTILGLRPPPPLSSLLLRPCVGYGWPGCGPAVARMCGLDGTCLPNAYPHATHTPPKDHRVNPPLGKLFFLIGMAVHRRRRAA